MKSLLEIKKDIQERAEANSRQEYQIDNLQDKNIKDFTSEDTLYISQTAGDNRNTYLCEFISYESGKIRAKVLVAMTNPSLHYYVISKGIELNVNIDKVSLYGRFDEDSHSFYHGCNVFGNFRSSKALENSDADTIKNHESFGVVRFGSSSVSGSVPLFGSSIKHSNLITLEIQSADLDRKLGKDWIHGKKPLVKVVMSRSQFAELISSFNMGEGVPCTINYFNGQRMEAPPYENKVQQFQQEFSKKMSNIVTQIENIMSDSTEILNGKKAVGKADKEHILSSLTRIKQEIGSNVPFITTSFAEQMSKTVEQAKLEIESFVQAKGLKNEDIKILE